MRGYDDGGGDGGRGLKGRRIDTSMTDADGSIVQPDYVIKCWRVTHGISVVEGEGWGEWKGCWVVLVGWGSGDGGADL